MASEFEQLELTSTTAPVDTVLEGSIDDSAALHGILRRIEVLGLELVEVRRLVDDPGAETRSATAARADALGRLRRADARRPASDKPPSDES